MARVTSVRIVLDPVTVRTIPAELVAPLVADATREVLNRARVQVNVRTGNLRASLRMTMRAGKTFVEGKVSTRVKYALYVHDPTAPHTIRAKRPGGFLRFPWQKMGGKVVYFRQVWHPGYRGNPYLRQPLAEVGTAKGFRVTGFGAATAGRVGWGMSD